MLIGRRLTINLFSRKHILNELFNSVCCRPSTSSSRQLKLEKKDEDRVLAILNGKSKDELFRYPISKVRIEKIHRWKSKNGIITNIEDLLNLDGFGVKMLEKLCTNILKHENDSIFASPLPLTKRAGAFTVPTLSVSTCDLYKSVLSIFTSVSSIACAHINLNENGPCELISWRFYDIGEKRMHLSDLVENLFRFIQILPHADCYVMENPQLAQAAAPGGAEQVNINVQKAQIMAVLNYGLASRRKLNEDHVNVFYLKKYLSSRIFSTLVGSERISTENVVMDLMRTDYNVNDWIDTSNEGNSDNVANITLRSNINFSADTRQIYNNAERYQRDFMGQALLIGMTFIRLCLLRSPESVSIVSRSSKNDIE